MGLALLSAAERSLATGSLGTPALRAMLRNLYGGVFVHRGGTGAKDRFRERHGSLPPGHLLTGAEEAVRAFRVSGFPTFIVIDGAGRAAGRLTSSRGPAAVRAILESLGRPG